MDDVRRIMKGLQARGRVLNYAVDFVRKDGIRIPASMSVSLLHRSDGTVDGTISISKDMTEQRELERNLRELSIRDSLSGLYNRRYFRERLTSELVRARRQGHTMSVLLFDIDDFKLYNDTHGHLAGDKMIEQLGDIVRECIREEVDVPFRYGGDEFTVLLVETNPDQAYDIAERIRVSFSKFTRAESTLSIGMLARAEGMDEEAIVREVDRRMYRAKRAGGDQIAS
jgi:diguanylate cyclase (GGDEF)-like protein